ncbi:hypothetical protein C0081_10395 [Cohaesibacter celericrescens]|uniref:Uncharacterized protein n=1 Tax=Cohaesibacter celericrescens TaxID=2067669 RepID=A0A2N5XTE2_9HYPH|nr:hypothetical protein C0081_10395 [Cohaesibacter celericrescens]
MPIHTQRYLINQKLIFGVIYQSSTAESYGWVAVSLAPLGEGQSARNPKAKDFIDDNSGHQTRTNQ